MSDGLGADMTGDHRTFHDAGNLDLQIKESPCLTATSSDKWTQRFLNFNDNKSLLESLGKRKTK